MYENNKQNTCYILYILYIYIIYILYIYIRKYIYIYVNIYIRKYIYITPSLKSELLKSLNGRNGSSKYPCNSFSIQNTQNQIQSHLRRIALVTLAEFAVNWSEV